MAENYMNLTSLPKSAGMSWGGELTVMKQSPNVMRREARPAGLVRLCDGRDLW